VRAFLKVALGTVLTATALTAAATGPAQATASGSCGANFVCMWEDPGFNGTKYVDVVGQTGFYDIDGWDGDNEISSVINRTGYYVRMYANDNATGFLSCVAPGQSIASLYFDNDAESFSLNTTCN
jgi:peptidase inhibitor family I36